VKFLMGMYGFYVEGEGVVGSGEYDFGFRLRRYGMFCRTISGEDEQSGLYHFANSQ
jgi:hypothetical protein